MNSHRILCHHPEGMGHFAKMVARGFPPEVEVRFTDTLEVAKLCEEVWEWKPNVLWIEWGAQIGASILELLGPTRMFPRVVVRVHSYEVYDLQPVLQKMKWHHVDKVVCIAPWVAEKFQAITGVEKAKVVVVPNGIPIEHINLNIEERPPSLAWIGYINHKKDPMVGLHLMQVLCKLEPQLQCHILGTFQDERYVDAFQHFLKVNKLQDRVSLHGWVPNVGEWLNEHKPTHILCTSLCESQGVALCEALASGASPIIYDFPGSEFVYPPWFRFSNYGEAVKLFTKTQNPAHIRDFVAKAYSLPGRGLELAETLLNEELEGGKDEALQA